MKGNHKNITQILNNTAKQENRLIPRKYQFGETLEYSPFLMPELTIPDQTVYIGKKGNGRTSKIDVENEAMWKKGEPTIRALIKAGISPHVAAAVGGNIALESAFDHKSNRNGNYHGLTQNETKAKNWIVSTYGGYDLSHQMRFLLDGLQGKIKDNNKIPWLHEFYRRFNGFLNAVRNNNNVDHITKAWESNYERSGGQGMQTRMRYARYFAKKLGLK